MEDFPRRDEVFSILLQETDLPSLLQACRTNRIFAEVCSDEYFWEVKLEQDYPGAKLRRGETFRQAYRRIYGSNHLDVFLEEVHQGDIYFRPQTLAVLTEEQRASFYTGTSVVRTYFPHKGKQILLYTVNREVVAVEAYGHASQRYYKFILSPELLHQINQLHVFTDFSQPLVRALSIHSNEVFLQLFQSESLNTQGVPQLLWDRGLSLNGLSKLEHDLGNLEFTFTRPGYPTQPPAQF